MEKLLKELPDRVIKALISIIEDESVEVETRLAAVEELRTEWIDLGDVDESDGDWKY